jgi:pimeloyl-ACP methyl ester carboxylesterase
MYRTYSKFAYHGSTLHYSVYGNGPKTLLMFHGFGQTMKQMRGMEELLASEYKIFSFDLFFHGFSEWKQDDSPIHYDFWQKMISALLLEEGVEKFGLLGYSLGAKVALSTFELFPDRTESLCLIAPDGLKSTPFYNIITSPMMKGLFRNVIMHPELFKKMVAMLSSLRLVNKSVLRFASIQMNTRDKRRRVYYTWTVYKGFKPNVEHIITLINQKQVDVEIFTGKYDNIIKPSHVKPFADRIKHVRYSVLNSGHNNLLDAATSQMEKEGAKR